jgi:hypothetical protein
MAEVKDTKAEAKIEVTPDGFKKFANPTDELAALQLSLIQAQLENANAEKEERKARAEEHQLNLLDVRQRVEKRQMDAQQRQESRQQQGRVFAQDAAIEAARQEVCTHKKGGIVTPRDMAVLTTGGDSQQFAVIKHRMIDGNLFVRCMRCSRTWVPPKKENFFFDRKRNDKDRSDKILKAKRMPFEGPQVGIFDELSFQIAIEEYKKACAFQTQNKESGSVICQFSKWNEETKTWDAALGKAEYDRGMLNTTLR